MAWWLHRRENQRGEWTVVDRKLGYCICAYNHLRHGGTHLHSDLSEGDVYPIDIPGPQEAEAIMFRYAKIANKFEWSHFKEVLGEWKSESNRS